MKELAAGGVSVAVMCRVLTLARQPYYRWLAHPVTPAEALRQDRVAALSRAHREDREFGFPMADRTAWRLCSDAGIMSAVQRRRRGKGTRPSPPVHDDHVQRVFAAEAPNRLWLTDGPGRGGCICAR